MQLCLDIGNTQIHGGIYKGDKLITDFRLNTKQGWSSDQLGIIMRTILRERKIELDEISNIGISSVVPSLNYHTKNACLKYFHKNPLFIQMDVESGIKLSKFKNPNEIGADLISSAACAIMYHPKQNLLIADLGTATTITAISEKHYFLGGIILPGLQTQINSLVDSAEKLSITDITRPKSFLGKTTTHSIQSGIYYGHLGALKFMLNNIAEEVFNGSEFKIIGTGGFSRMFKNEQIFDIIYADLVLRGILTILRKN